MKYGLIVAFTRDGEATLQKYQSVIDPSIGPYIQVQTCKFSYATMWNDELRFSADLGKLGMRAGSAIEIMDNYVNFYIETDDKERLESAVQNGDIVIPDSVEIEFGHSDSLMPPTPTNRETTRVSPDAGATGVPLLPTFQWAPCNACYQLSYSDCR